MTFSAPEATKDDVMVAPFVIWKLTLAESGVLYCGG
jgi:hypothetical protein